MIGLLDKFLKKWNKLIRKEMTSFHFPFKRKYRISSPYGWRINRFTKKRQYHNGIDIAVPIGTFVYPTATGKVIHIEYQRHLSGKFVRIEHANGLVSAYAHLKMKVFVNVGDVIDRNTALGQSGNTGRSTGPHLHFMFWKSRKRKGHIDPLTILVNDC